MNDVFLFSVDLEDVRFAMPDGRRYEGRVPEMARRYMSWLKKKGSLCTFFVVGDVAEAYPELIREIADAGHEIGCHTSRHIPIERQAREEFKKDLEANIDALRRAGVPAVAGFRAPMFTLTASTAWAYGVLSELGFAYSSSVLPAKNPFACWPEFGPDPRRVAEGIWELPMSVAKFGPLTVPFAGGVYLRTLPKFLVMRAVARNRRAGRPLLGYVHPYDIDTRQERFMHPDINDSRFYNFLMYYNKRNVFRRLDAIINKGFRVVRYSEFVKSLDAGAAPA
jgi:polysaccharide deacetylase family protein (PEP-CTERM system associated)